MFSWKLAIVWGILMRGKTITISAEAYDLLIEERKICIENAYARNTVHVPVTFICPHIGNRATELILMAFGKIKGLPTDSGVYRKDKQNPDKEKEKEVTV